MSNIVYDVDSTAAVDAVSSESDFIGHFTVSIADTTVADMVSYDGEVYLDEKINGNWVPSQEFDAVGVYPGFNAVKGTYRIRVKKVTAANSSAQVVVRGWDKPTGIPY